MYQIITYNEEKNRAFVAEVMPESVSEEEAFRRFREHMIDRACELLQVDRKEAEKLLDNDSEKAYMDMHHGEANGTIVSKWDFIENHALVEVPLPEEKEEREEEEEAKKLKETVSSLRSIVSSALSELYEGAEEEYADSILDLIGTSEEELQELGVRI